MAQWFTVVKKFSTNQNLKFTKIYVLDFEAFYRSRLNLHGNWLRTGNTINKTCFGRRRRPPRRWALALWRSRQQSTARQPVATKQDRESRVTCANSR